MVAPTYFSVFCVTELYKDISIWYERLLQVDGNNFSAYQPLILYSNGNFCCHGKNNKGLN